MITCIPRTKAVTTQWSGGTTTEFYLAPATGSYAKREFTIRISSATVDLEASDFTLLPDYNRIITPLKGGFTLTFPEDNNRTVTLKPLELAFFDGAWHTHSVGKAVDFNVMTKKGLRATCNKLATSTTLPVAPYRFVYVPFLTAEMLKGATLSGTALAPDTLYVLSADDPGTLTLPQEAPVLFITVQ